MLVVKLMVLPLSQDLINSLLTLSCPLLCSLTMAFIIKKKNAGIVE